MPTGLQRRNARYHIRRRVPLDLVKALGRAEITRALGTSDPKEARRLLPLAWASLDQEFEQLRVSVAEQAGLLEARATTDRQRPFDVDAYATKALDALRSRQQDAAVAGTLSAFREEMQDDLRWQQASLDHGPLVLDGQTVTEALGRAEATRNAIRAILTGEPMLRVGIASIQPAARPPSHTLIQVWEKWAAERRPTARAIEAHRRVAQRLIQFLGRDRVADFGRCDLLSFKDDLVAKGQSAANIKALLSRLNTLFNFAVSNDLLPSNPVANVKVVDKQRKRDKRREWPVESLNRLFSSEVYAAAARPRAGGGEAAYWLPLLGLYTGARLTELGQLHPDDVAQEGYRTASDDDLKAWVVRFDADEERGQRLKTEGSARRVPLHAALIELGFIELVRAASESGQTRLFPDIVPGSQDLMGSWSKWFGRYRRSIGLGGADMPFHSLRHSFKHYARQSLIPTEVSNAITGHETGDVADDYGGLQFPLAPLVEGMKAYRVPGLVLPKRSLLAR